MDSLDARARLSVVVSEFLYREADLLDGWHLNEWLDLLAPDCRYRVYANELVGTGTVTTTGKPPEPVRQLIVDDDRDFLAIRVARLEAGLASCERPASLTRHFIGNVYVQGQDNDLVQVHSSFIVYQHRTDTHLLMGDRVDKLRMSNGNHSLQLVERTANLTHTVTPRTISVFV